MTKETRVFGLIGFPLGHSFSKRYFEEKFTKDEIEDAEYRNFSIPQIEEVKRVFETPGIRGFNVTIPYKEVILPFIDELSEMSEAVGAVNCVRISNGKVFGFNTDVYGFKKAFENEIIRPCLIIGTGGGSKAVQMALSKLDIPFKTISREVVKGDLVYDDIDASVLEKYPVLINCTPLGMSPDILTYPPVPYDLLGPDNLAIDLIYNPEVTKFLSLCEERECRTINGAQMLQLQAEKSWEIWNES